MYESVDQTSHSSSEELSQDVKEVQLDEVLDEKVNRIGDITIPYDGKLPQELDLGSYIKIFGKTERNAIRFAIDLMTATQDVAFHFNPRIKDGSIVRNSRLNNDWYNEEREIRVMPFAKDQTFTLIISVEKELYRLFLNGIYLLDFRHRLPYRSVTSIAIDGDIQVWWIEFDRIEYDHNWDAFSNILPSPNDPLRQRPEIQTFFDPSLPFYEEIPSGLRVGMVLSIIGNPDLDCRRFDINLIQGKDFDRNPNIAFHMSVRFGKTHQESTLVRNYRSEGEWGNEDRYCTDFPFEKEKMFDLRIVVENSRFIVILNGKNLTEFQNRLYPLSDTDRIQIRSEGKLRLYSVRF